MQPLSTIARNYYSAMENKSVQELEKYLDPDVQFISPLGKMSGKENVLNAAKGFMNIFDSLEIKQKLDNDQGSAVVVFDLMCPAPIGTFRAATLMTIKDNLITKMELFYDPRPFEKK